MKICFLPIDVEANFFNRFKRFEGDTYFALPKTDLSLLWLPGFVAFSANNKLQSLKNKSYRMHFKFVNTSSVTNRLPASFEATITTLERVGQLYDNGKGGCVLINGGLGSGKSYFLRRKFLLVYRNFTCF